jgi:hypothetical protein
MHFESEEIAMEKVIPFSKTLVTIFYFDFFGVWEGWFWDKSSLNEFELFQN